MRHTARSSPAITISIRAKALVATDSVITSMATIEVPKAIAFYAATTLGPLRKFATMSVSSHSIQLNRARGSSPPGVSALINATT